MRTAILIGNDINNLSPGFDWGNILSELIDFVGARNELHATREQFPLFYEEIWSFANSRRTRYEDEIKRFISDKVQQLRPNAVHKELSSLGVTELLTTNYEFTLEQSRRGSSLELMNDGIVGERRYSLFRHYKVDGIRFWHIHGDAQHPASIALGYEHYSGYLQNMRNYVVAGTGKTYRKVRIEPLVKRLKRNEEEIKSWLDLFFTHDIHIVGLGMDFVEIHLWWLLTYRARALNGTKMPQSNRIYYYYPKKREEQDRTKLRFLRANNVSLEACDDPNDTREAYYGIVINRITKALKH